MVNIAYKRVSTATQNTDRQDFKGIEIEKVFEDKVSGSSLDRPQLQACLDYVREGDRLYVHSIDRLARSLQDLTKTVNSLTEKGVTVTFIKEGLTFTADTSNPTNELMLSVLGAIAQFERAILKERQAEGIAKAKAKGKYKGRTEALTAEQITALRADAKAGIPKTKLAKKYNVGRTTVYKYI